MLNKKTKLKILKSRKTLNLALPLTLIALLVVHEIAAAAEPHAMITPEIAIQPGDYIDLPLLDFQRQVDASVGFDNLDVQTQIVEETTSEVTQLPLTEAASNEFNAKVQAAEESFLVEPENADVPTEAAFMARGPQTMAELNEMSVANVGGGSVGASAGAGAGAGAGAAAAGGSAIGSMASLLGLGVVVGGGALAVGAGGGGGGSKASAPVATPTPVATPVELSGPTFSAADDTFDVNKLNLEKWDHTYNTGPGNDAVIAPANQDVAMEVGYDSDITWQLGEDNDTFQGGSLDDKVAPGTGQNTVYGAEGSDTVYKDASVSLKAHITDRLVSVQDITTKGVLSSDILKNIEKLVFSRVSPVDEGGEAAAKAAAAKAVTYEAAAAKAVVAKAVTYEAAEAKAVVAKAVAEASESWTARPESDTVHQVTWGENSMVSGAKSVAVYVAAESNFTYNALASDIASFVAIQAVAVSEWAADNVIAESEWAADNVVAKSEGKILAPTATAIFGSRDNDYMQEVLTGSTNDEVSVTVAAYVQNEKQMAPSGDAMAQLENLTVLTGDGVDNIYLNVSAQAGQKGDAAVTLQNNMIDGGDGNDNINVDIHVVAEQEMAQLEYAAIQLEDVAMKMIKPMSSINLSGNTISGGAGDDHIAFKMDFLGSMNISAEDNMLDGGAGMDILDLSGIQQSLTVDLAEGTMSVRNGDAIFSCSVQGFENVVGAVGQFTNTYIGSDENNSFTASSAYQNIFESSGGSDQYTFNADAHDTLVVKMSLDFTGADDKVTGFDVESDYIDVTDFCNQLNISSSEDNLLAVLQDGKHLEYGNFGGNDQTQDAKLFLTIDEHQYDLTVYDVGTLGLSNLIYQSGEAELT